MPRELVFDTASEAFVVREYELPPLGPREAQVRIELAAPKHGTEAHGWAGNVNRGRRWDADLRLFLAPHGEEASRPATMRVGNMAVGAVTAVGSAVEDYRPGDRVYGYMPVREVHQMPVERLTHLSDDLAPEAAVCIDPAHVALVAVRDGRVRLGDAVAVFGLGAIGLLTVQAAHASGALCVVAVDPLADRRERALDMGADVAVDPLDGDDAGLAIKEATGRRGADVALETSGADAAMHEAIRGIRQCGTVVAVGWGSGTGAGLYLGEEFHVNRPTIVASQASSYWGNPDRDHPLWDEPRAQATCAALFRRGLLSAQGILDPVVDLAEAAEVLRAVRAHPERVLKVGIRMG